MVIKQKSIRFIPLGVFFLIFILFGFVFGLAGSLLLWTGFLVAVQLGVALVARRLTLLELELQYLVVAPGLQSKASGVVACALSFSSARGFFSNQRSNSAVIIQ